MSAFLPLKVDLFFLDIIMLSLNLIFCGFSVGALQGHQDRGECEHQQGFQRQDLCLGQVCQLTLKGLSHEMDLAFDDMYG